MDCIDSCIDKDSYLFRINDLNGYMMVCLSQPLAIVPYLFRSLRLRKMYEARQIYWLDNKMPK